MVRCCEMVFPKPTCDRLLHKSSENSPLSASGEMPSANSIPGCASGVDDQIPLVSFLLLATTPERGAPVVSSAGNGNACCPLAPFFAPPDPSRNEPAVWGHPRREGSNRSISPLFGFARCASHRSFASALVSIFLRRLTARKPTAGNRKWTSWNSPINRRTSTHGRWFPTMHSAASGCSHAIPRRAHDASR